MFSLGTRRSQSEGIFKKINVFSNLQREIPVFKEISVIIFIMCKFVQIDISDPLRFISKYLNVSN